MTCSECSNVTSRDDDFSEIMLKFPLQQPSAETTRVKTRHTLANLYDIYKNEVIDDFMCIPCNSRTSATRQEHTSQCPKIFTVVLLRNADNENGSIDSAVDFPLEQVCPSTLGVQQGDLASNTEYKLFGIVQHTLNANYINKIDLNLN